MQYDGSPFAQVYNNNFNSHGHLRIATQSTDSIPNYNTKQYHTTSYSPLAQESDITEEAPAVAYYIEPGGRMVPVDISSSTEPIYGLPASQAPSVRGVRVQNEVHVYNEPVQQQGGVASRWMPGPGQGPSQPGLGGYEAQAAFAGQGGQGSGWMGGR
jgi:hypothetical protein